MAGQRPGMTPSAQQGSPQLISPPRQGSMMPVAMNQSPQAVRRQTPVPPYRLMGPQRVTTSYTVVRSGSSSSVAGPSRSSVASGFVFINYSKFTKPSKNLISSDF